jgi:hypothetical protein
LIKARGATAFVHLDGKDEPIEFCPIDVRPFELVGVVAVISRRDPVGVGTILDLDSGRLRLEDEIEGLAVRLTAHWRAKLPPVLRLDSCHGTCICASRAGFPGVVRRRSFLFLYSIIWWNCGCQPNETARMK